MDEKNLRRLKEASLAAGYTDDAFNELLKVGYADDVASQLLEMEPGIDWTDEEINNLLTILQLTQEIHEAEDKSERAISEAENGLSNIGLFSTPEEIASAYDLAECLLEGMNETYERWQRTPEVAAAEKKHVARLWTAALNALSRMGSSLARISPNLTQVRSYLPALESAQRGMRRLLATAKIGPYYPDPISQSSVKAAEDLLLQMTKIKISVSQSASQSSSSGCYVATCVYGSYDCPQVWALRRFRDYDLAETRHGRAFIKAYYAISPTLVRWFGGTEWFKRMWQGSLDRLVAKCKAKGYKDTPYKDRIW